MNLLLNVLWLIFGGLIGAISFFVEGVLWCITIVGIPFGRQAFKLSKLCLAPFGKVVRGSFFSHPIANTLWFIFGGFAIAAAYVVCGIILCITVIGIPVGKQAFKFARLSACPFGASVDTARGRKRR